MTRLLRITLCLCGVLLLTELGLRQLPVSSATQLGYHLDSELLVYPPGHRWTVSTGWDLRNPQRLQANNMGFAASRDFVPDVRAVALIGDSFVEASMLPDRDRPGSQLQTLLPDRPVYAMGAPGSALLDYGRRVHWAHQRFGVREFVLLLEAGDARQALCNSGNVHSRCLDPNSLAPKIQRRTEAGLAKRWLRHSALAQYLFGQLKFEPARFLRSAFTRQTPEASQRRHERGESNVDELKRQQARRINARAVEEFFRLLAPVQPARLIVLLDGRRDGALSPASDGQFERADLIQRLRGGGADVIDLEPLYAQHRRRSPLRLEVGPYDGHLNRLGVDIAMRAAAERFR